MTDTLHYVLLDKPHSSRTLARNQCENLPSGYHVTFSEPTRTLEQNAAQYPYLEGLSRGKLWPVNGEKCKLSRDEWKDLLTAAFEKETNPRIAAGIDGGIVMLGRKTSKYSKKKFSEWLEFLIATCAIWNIEPYYEGENDGN